MVNPAIVSISDFYQSAIDCCAPFKGLASAICYAHNRQCHLNKTSPVWLIPLNSRPSSWQDHPMLDRPENETTLDVNYIVSVSSVLSNLAVVKLCSAVLPFV